MNQFQLYIYTDGSYDMSKGIGGYALVVVNNQDQEIYREFQKVENSTSNRMEYTALIAALNYLQQHQIQDSVLIQTDSQLLVNTYNLWMDNWAKNNWVRNAGEIKNLDLVKQLYDLKPRFSQVQLKWIKGHNGHKWNELVDELTRKAYQLT